MGAPAQPPLKLGGTSRSLSIPTCSLDSSDLRDLHDILSRAAATAAEKELDQIRRTGVSADELKSTLAQARSALQLVIRLEKATGDWIHGTDSTLLSGENLLKDLARVHFNSAVLFRVFANRDPFSWVSVTIDFTAPPVFDISNPSGVPTPNASSCVISGTEGTWAHGVFQELSQFFDGRRTKRTWLHSGSIYDILLLVLGLPLSLGLVVRASYILPATWTGAAATAFYVYLALLALALFRLLFGYARWVFPRIEKKSSDRSSVHRYVLGLLFFALVSECRLGCR